MVLSNPRRHRDRQAGHAVTAAGIQTFICPICRRERLRANGRPVENSPNDSWRCADEGECGTLFLTLQTIARVP